MNDGVPVTSPPPVFTLYSKKGVQHFVRVPYHEGAPDAVDYHEGWWQERAVLASVEIPSGNLSGMRALGRTCRVVLG